MKKLSEKRKEQELEQLEGVLEDAIFESIPNMENEDRESLTDAVKATARQWFQSNDVHVES